MPKPERHVFVCGQVRPENHPRGSCGHTGAPQVFQAFGAALTKSGLLGKVALTNTGCLGPCQVGTNVLVYPEGTMYTQVQAEDVGQIVEQHLLKGEPVVEKLAPAEVW
ncbi:(2Fe-2S) ferredoxin domain-containing protein [Halioxenophilus sp. WMMB6]|uniref:(2Fe-2S) ferredoxin domain-containing protein n=1 Tax=Halioxenophilus sp. WMMB6 TaxID=3073815 RepID=UPI00295F01BD|nr:(2Fe-2S) ferredoxin domain-containing protein [Halioxenophilus sp. WMMB6]